MAAKHNAAAEIERDIAASANVPYATAEILLLRAIARGIAELIRRG